jgi:hypothetical protein
MGIPQVAANSVVGAAAALGALQGRVAAAAAAGGEAAFSLSPHNRLVNQKPIEIIEMLINRLVNQKPIEIIDMPIASRSKFPFSAARATTRTPCDGAMARRE